ncbi:hypothetical protein JL09_g5680, partial [Pichia kudriavzevii]
TQIGIDQDAESFDSLLFRLLFWLEVSKYVVNTNLDHSK